MAHFIPRLVPPFSTDWNTELSRLACANNDTEPFYKEKEELEKYKVEKKVNVTTWLYTCIYQMRVTLYS